MKNRIINALLFAALLIGPASFAQVKVSQLPAANTLTGDELLPIVQGGVSKRTTAQEIADLASGGSGPTYIAGHSIGITGDIIYLDTLTDAKKAATQGFVTRALAAYIPMPLWSQVQSKPSSFPPSAHTHLATEITQSSTHRFVTDAQIAAWDAGVGEEAEYATLSGTTWDGLPAYKLLSSNTALTLTTARINGIIYVQQDATGSRTLSINGQSITVGPGADDVTGITFSIVNGDYFFTVDDVIVASAGLTTPSPPTTPVTNDAANTFGWTDAGGLDYTDAEYTINGGSSYANATANPQTGIGNVALAIGQVGVRYKAVPGVSNVSSTLYNTVAFTVADVTPPTITAREATDAETIEITGSESTAGTHAGFSAKVNGGSAIAATGISGTGVTRQLTFPTTSFANGDVITLSYNSGTGNTADAASNVLASFTDAAVTNSIGSSNPITAVSGLLAYFEMGTGAWQNSGQTVAATNGGTVSAVDDIAGVQDLIMVNGSNAANNPLYNDPGNFNAEPDIYFDGAATGLKRPTIDAFPSKRGSVFIVYLRATWTGSSKGTMVGTYPNSAAQPSNTDWAIRGDNAGVYFYDGTTDVTLSTTTPTVGHVLGVVRDGDTNIRMYLDANSSSNITIANNTPGAKDAAVGIGPNLSSAYGGYIAAIVVYDHDVTNVEATAIMNYLNTKFN